MKRICAVSMGPSTHFDHLAPICYYLQIPLIVAEAHHLKIMQTFYPMVEVIYQGMDQLSLENLATWDVILTSGKFWAMELGEAMKLICGKSPQFVFAPHGYSDKEELLNKPFDQPIRLVYTKNEPFLQGDEKICPMGNIRLAFYKQFQDHFDKLTSHLFDSKKPTVFYAPTWESRSTSTSFFDQAAQVVENLKDDYHLIVKPHPFLKENNPGLYYRFIALYEDKVQIIEDFPIIYPLLEKSDIYLGDYSSIGYDFLYYDRPMFFLKEGGKLQKGGRPFEQCLKDHQLDLSLTRKRLYKEAFGQESLHKALKISLEKLLS